MEKERIEKGIIEALDDYRNHEEAYGDDTYLEVDIVNGSVRLITGDEADSSAADCYAVQDLMKPDPENPAVWAVDTDALGSLLAEI